MHSANGLMTIGDYSHSVNFSVCETAILTDSLRLLFKQIVVQDTRPVLSTQFLSESKGFNRAADSGSAKRPLGPTLIGVPVHNLV